VDASRALRASKPHRSNTENGTVPRRRRRREKKTHEEDPIV
jgi:hypothetical protein